MGPTDIVRAVQELDDEGKLNIIRAIVGEETKWDEGGDKVDIIRALLEVEDDDWDSWQGEDWRHGGEKNVLIRITVPDWWDWIDEGWEWAPMGLN